jgi:hypothetical protein
VRISSRRDAPAHAGARHSARSRAIVVGRSRGGGGVYMGSDDQGREGEHAKSASLPDHTNDASKRPTRRTRRVHHEQPRHKSAAASRRPAGRKARLAGRRGRAVARHARRQPMPPHPSPTDEEAAGRERQGDRCRHGAADADPTMHARSRANHATNGSAACSGRRQQPPAPHAERTELICWLAARRRRCRDGSSCCRLRSTCVRCRSCRAGCRSPFRCSQPTSAAQAAARCRAAGAARLGAARHARGGAAAAGRHRRPGALSSAAPRRQRPPARRSWRRW